MTAVEALIRSRTTAALAQSKHYVDFLRAEDLKALFEDLDAVRLELDQYRAEDVAISEGLEVRRGDSEPTAWRVPTPATPPPDGFAALYVTFGTVYAREPHESGLPWPHPDGFLTVHYRDDEEVAGTYVAPFGRVNQQRTAHERARQTVMAYLGGHFATSYTEVPTEWVPWGQLALMVLP